MSRFTIEGLNEYGQWLRSSVGADSANVFESREAAEFELAQLAQIFECPAAELRVVELPEIDPDAQCPEHGCARWRCDVEHKAGAR